MTPAGSAMTTAKHSATDQSFQERAIDVQHLERDDTDAYSERGIDVINERAVDVAQSSAGAGVPPKGAFPAPRVRQAEVITNKAAIKKKLKEHTNLSHVRVTAADAKPDVAPVARPASAASTAQSDRAVAGVRHGDRAAAAAERRHSRPSSRANSADASVTSDADSLRRLADAHLPGLKLDSSANSATFASSEHLHPAVERTLRAAANTVTDSQNGACTRL